MPGRHWAAAQETVFPSPRTDALALKFLLPPLGAASCPSPGAGFAQVPLKSLALVGESVKVPLMRSPRYQPCRLVPHEKGSQGSPSRAAPPSPRCRQLAGQGPAPREFAARGSAAQTLALPNSPPRQPPAPAARGLAAQDFVFARGLAIQHRLYRGGKLGRGIYRSFTA